MKRHTQAEMEHLYREWQESGASKPDFATSHDIRPSTFYYWSRKFEQQPESLTSGFHHIDIESTVRVPDSSPMATIHYPSGVRLELYTCTGTTEIELLKKLIS